MPRPSQMDLVDRLLDGKLASILSELRADNVSYDDMSRHFKGLGFDLSRETLRRWVKTLDASEKVA